EAGASRVAGAVRLAVIAAAFAVGRTRAASRNAAPRPGNAARQPGLHADRDHLAADETGAARYELRRDRRRQRALAARERAAGAVRLALGAAVARERWIAAGRVAGPAVRRKRDQNGVGV